MKCPMHRDHGPPRRCRRDGCGVWLSSYNPDEVCSEHGGWKPRKVDDTPKAQRTRGDDLGEVMAA